MEIKVNVPKGFKAVYKWVDGDLVITIEREVVATVHSPKAAKGGLRYYMRGVFRAAPGLAKGKVETRKDGVVVIHVVTDKQPTISQSGTGSTGPRKPHA
ncbi:hypothetical protein [Pseudomonas chlororaphis]|uniref:hypothetical protein n=1 Tax=Pseudomonas chlororaphis TaxID=587753 RepID=UPI000F567894|nr:hypothetical protein [Pseudomonas chlororaphis]